MAAPCLPVKAGDMQGFKTLRTHDFSNRSIHG